MAISTLQTDNRLLLLYVNVSLLFPFPLLFINDKGNKECKPLGIKLQPSDCVFTRQLQCFFFGHEFFCLSLAFVL